MLRSKLKNIDVNVVCLLVLSAILRLVNLGYSDYQGDEIRALFLPGPDQNLFSYLLDQRKGPLQFLVTYLLKFIDPTYMNYFLMRLPFALAGIAAVYFFYKFVSLLLDNKRIAFFASLFLATNGFYVAFSRIVQYQSLTIFFMILALYFFTLSYRSKSFGVKGLYFGAVAWALSILSHYDGIFIFPMVVYAVYEWFRATELPVRTKIRHVLLSGLTFAVLNLIFYVPFVVTLSKSTTDYWLGRITGSASEKESSSQYLFNIYNPLFALKFYIAMFFLGVVWFIKQLVPSRNLLTHLLNLRKNYNTALTFVSILAWIFAPLFFMEVLVKFPGTHIYTYLLPLFIVLGCGIELIYCLRNISWKSRFLRFISKAIAALLVFTAFSFISYQSYMIYVDNTQEYPWEDKTILNWKIKHPDNTYVLSLFGFPYYRDWKNIGFFMGSMPAEQFYFTNEKVSISKFYVPVTKSSTNAGFYVYIHNPQSFEDNITDVRAAYWAKKHPPVFTLSRHGTDFVRVYILPHLTKDEMISQGF